ncbi:MAG TPA: DegT/DnrJ/EryC1/StrS family aminotransferase [Acidimicrobiales bacterium]|jgi:dTDP-4-amino-4,6-dideoxygalactose transaminase|nr:DegT/DnrJ/EryC1/StrS family aminotransferase [Acidimicrobiales bacterium]
MSLDISEPIAAPRVPFVDLAAMDTDLRRGLREAFERVLATGRFSAGQEVPAFEDALAQEVGVDFAVGVASGTAALALMLIGAGIGPGDEVILPANTFFATLEAVVTAGAVPVLADAELATGSVDPASVEAAVTARTAAILGVHLYGTPVDADRLRAIATRHGLLFLEDAAQAIGARWNGRPAGALGDGAAFSFYPTKNLGALGEAGAVTTNDEALARRVRSLRSHGEVVKNVHHEYGFNERLDELQAAFLSVKLARLRREVEARRALGEDYRRLLADVPRVGVLDVPHRAQSSYHLFVVKVDHRDNVAAFLRSNGVETAVHYPTPIHLQPACRPLGLGKGAFPNAERLADTVLSLPFFPGLSREQAHHCVQAVSAATAGE